MASGLLHYGTILVSHRCFVKRATICCDGDYASIAVVDDRERASDYLLLARKFRRVAYVTPMASWCREMQPREGFIECKNTLTRAGCRR